MHTNFIIRGIDFSATVLVIASYPLDLISIMFSLFDFLLFCFQKIKNISLLTFFKFLKFLFFYMIIYQFLFSVFTFSFLFDWCFFIIYKYLFLFFFSFLILNFKI